MHQSRSPAVGLQILPSGFTTTFVSGIWFFQTALSQWLSMVMVLRQDHSGKKWASSNGQLCLGLYHSTGLLQPNSPSFSLSFIRCQTQIIECSPCLFLLSSPIHDLHIVLVICCITNHSQTYCLTATHIYYLIVTVGQEYECGLARSSASGSLTWLQSGAGQSWSLIWGLITERSAGFGFCGLFCWGPQFLAACCLEASLSPLPHGTSHRDGLLHQIQQEKERERLLARWKSNIL